MRQDLFAIPIFTDVVDLSKIHLYEKKVKPSFRTGIHSSYNCKNTIKKESLSYLNKIVNFNLSELLSTYKKIEIKQIWRNIYTETDYQDPHIHSGSQWSFIIYEKVEKSNTVFLNANRHMIETTMQGYDVSQANYYVNTYFMQDYKPNFVSGDIVIFPSFLEHFVLAGRKGSTISGNIHCFE
tara:strand:+ start:42 stop:587 length:546 start_codon:yes stop_codon:yes gene_type:complete